ncbi:hypothetical protein D3C85_1493370 [compost metagenome]
MVFSCSNEPSGRRTLRRWPVPLAKSAVNGLITCRSLPSQAAEPNTSTPLSSFRAWRRCRRWLLFSRVCKATLAPGTARRLSS